MIEEYKGTPARLRTYLIRKLQKMDRTAEWILAEAFSELLHHSEHHRLLSFSSHQSVSYSIGVRQRENKSLAGR